MPLLAEAEPFRYAGAVPGHGSARGPGPARPGVRRPAAGRGAVPPLPAHGTGPGHRRGREDRAAGPAGLRILTRGAVHTTVAVRRPGRGPRLTLPGDGARAASDGGLAFVRERGSSGEGAGHD